MERTAFAIETDLVTSDSYTARFEFIDRLIADTRQRFIDEGIDLAKARRDKSEALLALGLIEEELASHRLRLHILTETLTAGLTPRPAGSQWQYSRTRDQFFAANPDGDYYHFDCDIGSYLILAIAETLSLPVHLVEVPKHYFVRWRLTNGDFINWDTNSAREYTDDQFRKGDSPTAGTSFGAAEESALHYLTDLPESEIIGYHLALIAIDLGKAGHIEAAERYYFDSIQKRPYGALARNNLSWLYLTHEKFADAAHARRALELSLEVDRTDPNVIKFRDTLACAYAATGDFAQALVMEHRAYGKAAKLAGFRNRETCLDLIRNGDLDR